MARTFLKTLAPMLLSTLLAASAAAQLIPATQPVPEPAAQSKAEKLIRDVYQKEYASRAATDRAALARKLLQQANETKDDPPARYVLLREARDMAASTADMRTAAHAISQLSQIHGIDPVATTLTALIAAIRVAATPQAFSEIAHAAMATADQAVLADDYDSARQFAALAEAAAQKSQNVLLAKSAQARTHEIQVTATEAAQAQAARNALRQKPDHAPANLLVGRFLCFIKNDWDAGLPHLAKSADPTLAPLAQLDRSAPPEYTRRLELANSWWDIAQSHTGLSRKHLQARSAKWYRLALPALSGLNRSAAHKRLEAIDMETLKEMHLEPGLAAELFKGIEFSRLVTTRIDPQINFDWGLDAPDDALPKDNFSLRWTGLLRPAVGGRYELIVLANQGTRIWLDDKLVLDEPNLSRHRAGKRLPIDLSPGLHSIRIDYWDTTGIANMKLLWKPPGAAKDEPIPPSAFFHEPAAGGS